MKTKVYIKPEVQMTEIRIQSLLIGSVSGLDGVTVGDEDFTGGNADSRRGSLWDDDED